eukprot:TRINITY_DN452_c0_g1_i2.p1 TRINITY_DN452_c0_g1~~TRINITY_DN452_c0_g1_i2.p1  ORF type:complete len:410 (-),score=10.66 TRINITY_DN452_c0_g1_i2:1155-2384(-)
MASMVYVALVALALAVPVLATSPFIKHDDLTCANTADFVCRTGKCSKDLAGVYDNWAVPYIKQIESCSCSTGCGDPYGKCTYAGPVSVPGYDYAFYIDSTLTPQACCKLCKKHSYQYGSFTATCAWWQWRSLAGTKSAFNGGYCYMYEVGNGKSLTPQCDAKDTLLKTVSYKTYVGAKCPSGNADPHFTGHQGARFDFNGMPGEAFCLVTDSNLHINTKLTGYLDSRMENAVKVVGGKAVRTWMRELGFLWTVAGEEHSLHMATREGPETERGDGFVALIKADGSELPKLKESEELTLGGGLVLRFIEVETEGPYTVEFYNVAIDGIVDMDLRVRVANAKLRTGSDAEVHFSFGINKLQVTPCGGFCLFVSAVFRSCPHVLFWFKDAAWSCGVSPYLTLNSSDSSFSAD